MGQIRTETNDYITVSMSLYLFLQEGFFLSVIAFTEFY